jgi:hypothetical protein
VQCYDLFLECGQHYDPSTQRITGPQGRVLANYSSILVAQTFYMLEKPHVVRFEIDVAKKFYD